VSVLNFQRVTGTLADGSTYYDGNISVGERVTAQSGSHYIGNDVQRPRYEWRPYGGRAADLYTWGTLAGGSRVTPTNAASHVQTNNPLRYYYHFEEMNTTTPDAGPAPYPLYSNLTLGVLHRKSDRGELDFGQLNNAWGQAVPAANNNVTKQRVLATGFSISDVYGLDLGNSVDGWRSADYNTPSQPREAQVSHPLTHLSYIGNIKVGWGWMYGTYLEQNYNLPAVFDPAMNGGVSQFLPPSTYFGGLGGNDYVNHVDAAISGNYDQLFQYWTFICYDTHTGEFVPPSEIDIDWDNASELMDVCVPSQLLSIGKHQNQWILSTLYNYYIGDKDANNLSPGKIDLNAPGRLTFKAEFAEHSSFEGFTRFVEYNRPLNLNSPFYAHTGYSVTVTEDQSNRLILYDEQAYNIISLAMMMGPSTYGEWFAPNAVGAVTAPWYDELSGNIIRVDHPTPTINRQFSIVPVDVQVGGANASHKVFGDICNPNFDYVISTEDGINYAHAVGFKHYNFTGESFGNVTGSQGMYIPILVGMLSMHSPYFKGVMPRVNIRRSI